MDSELMLVSDVCGDVCVDADWDTETPDITICVSVVGLWVVDVVGTEYVTVSVEPFTVIVSTTVILLVTVSVGPQVVDEEDVPIPGCVNWGVVDAVSVEDELGELSAVAGEDGAKIEEVAEVS
ncbi:hypothetical protein WOLCODRAFT_157658 [Wolfiporia cocos MD-104 SS10]|uniref:Uncharacterized protein n=1 Tax=Wolfiporia cocos (strain MD-104) TaxID=742152 RepID=A0A2H3J448_WOLCO|nr:hypothetical protein WOLCODRAFT_157658 [Wolfiporia cocos MD-104 SS10]